MTPDQIAMIGQIVGLVLEYGVPAVMDAVAALNKETVTAEDIESLHGLIKPPEQY